MMPTWVARIRASVIELKTRMLRHIDAHAKRDGEAWGSSMEYKRRYTNPDDAKKARTPPAPKEKS